MSAKTSVVLPQCDRCGAAGATDSYLRVPICAKCRKDIFPNPAVKQLPGQLELRFFQ